MILNNDVDTSTYQRTNFTKEEILINNRSILSLFGINTLDDDADLVSLYWIPKLHKDPYKHRFMAGSANSPVILDEKLTNFGKKTYRAEFFRIDAKYAQGQHTKSPQKSPRWQIRK